jgi:hypothetical protein
MGDMGRSAPFGDGARHVTEFSCVCTAVVNCHNEGALALHALRSAWQALSLLPSGELVLVLDAPDAATEGRVDDFLATLTADSNYRARKLVTQYRDLGLARNAACEAATGEYIAFLDADDLWGRSWLARAVAYLATVPTPAVAHPQVNVNFNTDRRWWEHVDSRAPQFDPSVFMITNQWSSLACAHSSVFATHPYRPVGGGFGFEDWEFNTRTLAAGIPHVVVPRTVHFIRSTPGTMSARHLAAAAVVHPNAFFDAPYVGPENAGEPASLAIGEWLTPEWTRAREIDPTLWACPPTLAPSSRYVQPSARVLYDSYYRIRSAVPPMTMHLVLFAGRGGRADRRVFRYAAGLAAAGGVVTLVATDGRSVGDADLSICEAAELLHDLAAPDRVRLLQRLMLQLADRMSIDVLDSAVVREVLRVNPEVFANHRIRSGANAFMRLFSRLGR